MREEYSSEFPVRLDNARAWRTYLGGKLLDQFHGCECGQDGHFPEEWIASLAAARNAGREAIKNEGLSRVEGADITLKELMESRPADFLGGNHVKQLGVTMGVLVKLIDSAERLAVQVHPDREMAMELFRSAYGKTECWHILGGRIVNGEKPCVYLGFRKGITQERWRELFEKQDIPGLLSCLHRFEVEPGDTILVEGGVPHAIGAGCFLVEIQEPTDYTIRVERTTPSGYQVEDRMCHQGVGFTQMFECFHYDGMSEEETRARWFIKQRQADGYEGGQALTLVGYEDTLFFKMNLLTVGGSEEMKTIGTGDCSGLCILEGEGTMVVGERSMTVKKGDQFFLPAQVNGVCWNGKDSGMLKMIQFFGPWIS